VPGGRGGQTDPKPKVTREKTHHEDARPPCGKNANSALSAFRTKTNPRQKPALKRKKRERRLGKEKGKATAGEAACLEDRENTKKETRLLAGGGGGGGGGLRGVVYEGLWGKKGDRAEGGPAVPSTREGGGKTTHNEMGCGPRSAHDWVVRKALARDKEGNASCGVCGSKKRRQILRHGRERKQKREHAGKETNRLTGRNLYQTRQGGGSSSGQREKVRRKLLPLGDKRNERRPSPPVGKKCRELKKDVTRGGKAPPRETQPWHRPAHKPHTPQGKHQLKGQKKPTTRRVCGGNEESKGGDP